MIVEWKQTRLNIIPVKGKKTIRLLPGLNDIPDNEWTLAKKNIARDYFKQFIFEHKIEVEKEEKIVDEKTGKEKTKKTKKTSTNFNDFPVEVARDMILDCFDEKTLKTWRKSTEKTDLRVLIEDRLKELKDTSNKKVEMKIGD